MIEFEAGYNRVGTIEIIKKEELAKWGPPGSCNSCKQLVDCLAIDSSEGEYGCGTICKPCIDKLFNESGK